MTRKAKQPEPRPREYWRSVPGYDGQYQCSTEGRMHNVRLRNNYLDQEKENWMPTKRNRYRKIDGFAALIDAWCVAQRNETTIGPRADEDVGDIAVYDIAAMRRR